MKSSGPKALVKIAGEALILRQIRLVWEVYPQAEIIVVGGHEAAKLKRALPPAVKFVLSTCPSTNVAYSIALGLKKCKCRSALVIYGDLVFTHEALTPFNRGQSAILLSGQMREEEVGVNHSYEQARLFAYGLPMKWGQMCYLAGDDKKAFAELASSPHHRRRFGYEVLNLLIASGSRFVCLAPPGLRLVEVDSPADLDSAERLCLLTDGKRVVSCEYTECETML